MRNSKISVSKNFNYLIPIFINTSKFVFVLTTFILEIKSITDVYTLIFCIVIGIISFYIMKLFFDIKTIKNILSFTIFFNSNFLITITISVILILSAINIED